METALGLIFTAIMFFLIGKIHERAAWNKLIDKGVLPKPKEKMIDNICERCGESVTETPYCNDGSLRHAYGGTVKVK